MDKSAGNKTLSYRTSGRVCHGTAENQSLKAPILQQLMKFSARSCSSVVPKPVAEKKDLATPRSVDVSQLSRRRKRLQRAKIVQNPSKGKRLLHFPWHEAMRAKLTKKLPPGSSHKFAFIWRSVHQTTVADNQKFNETISQLPACTVCNAQAQWLCPCGFQLRRGCRLDKVNDFLEFYYHPQNFVAHIWEPEDQRLFIAVYKRVLRTQPKTGNGIFHAALRVAYLGGMTGKQETVGECASSVIGGKLDEVQALLDSMDVVYRGGQHPGAVARDALAESMQEFEDKLGQTLCRHLKGLDRTATASQRSLGLFKCARYLTESAENKPPTVYGLSIYKAKKIMEMIILIGYSASGPWVLLQGDNLRSLTGAYPVPKNSADALKSMFPHIRNQCEYREAIRILERQLHKTNVVVIVAQLCFWRENEAGILNWRRTATGE